MLKATLLLSLGDIRESWMPSWNGMEIMCCHWNYFKLYLYFSSSENYFLFKHYSMLNKNPSLRPSALEILKIPYIDEQLQVFKMKGILGNILISLCVCPRTWRYAVGIRYIKNQLERRHRFFLKLRDIISQDNFFV